MNRERMHVFTDFVALQPPLLIIYNSKQTMLVASMVLDMCVTCMRTGLVWLCTCIVRPTRALGPKRHYRADWEPAAASVGCALGVSWEYPAVL